jgi:hypothetical protein
MRPQPRSLIGGATACESRKTARRLTATVWSNSATVNCSSGVLERVAALLTRTSIGPASATTRRQSSGSPRLAWIRPDADVLRDEKLTQKPALEGIIRVPGGVSMDLEQNCHVGVDVLVNERGAELIRWHRTFNGEDATLQQAGDAERYQAVQLARSRGVWAEVMRLVHIRLRSIGFIEGRRSGSSSPTAGPKRIPCERRPQPTGGAAGQAARFLAIS